MNLQNIIYHIKKMKKIALIIPEVKKQEEVSDQLSENEYSFRQKQWD
jgi:hypothetical protein